MVDDELRLKAWNNGAKLPHVISQKIKEIEDEMEYEVDQLTNT